MPLLLGMSIVQSPSVQIDTVRRALWLPRQPAGRWTVRDALRAAAGPAQVSIGVLAGAVSAVVHVIGGGVMAYEAQWLDLSAQGATVFAFFLSEGLRGSSYAVYERGSRVRFVHETSGREMGAPHPAEQGAGRDDPPAQRIRAIYTAIAGRSLDDTLDAADELSRWDVALASAAPRREAAAARRDTASRRPS